MLQDFKIGIKNRLQRISEAAIGNSYYNPSYSLEAEDMILKVLLKGKRNGFYIDVGAHHPKRFSNTQYFYQNGWRGINIDPLPGSMKLFRQHRRRDINLEIGIGPEHSTMTYYSFEDPAYNTIDVEIGENRIATNIKFKEKISIEVFPLSYILDKHLPQKQTIDFLSVDVEGYELEVLGSNDWQKYLPTIIVCEILGCDIEEGLNHVIANYLKQWGYKLVSKSYHSFFFQQTN